MTKIYYFTTSVCLVYKIKPKIAFGTSLFFHICKIQLVGEPLEQTVQKRGQVVNLTNSFLMITLVKYPPLTVRKCMSAQNYQSRKGKTCIFKNISLAGMNTHKNTCQILIFAHG